MPAPLNIAIACGGTGGHLYPGLAVARRLTERGQQTTLYLSGRSVESTIRMEWNGPTQTIPATTFSGVSTKSIKAAVLLLRGFFQARYELKRQKIQVLAGMGGYSIVAPVLAARSLGIPIILHEANAVPGRAITLLSRFAAAVGITFPESARHFRDVRTVQTGLPIRALPEGCIPDQDILTGHRPTLLVMGGSQGAQALNAIASRAIRELHHETGGFSVIHLAGLADAETVRRAYRAAAVPALVFDFLHEMGAAYRLADVALSRSGAGACMELASFRVPGILIPLPTSARNHQRFNAEAMVKGGGYQLLDQPTLTAEGLKQVLTDWLTTPTLRDRMRAAIPNVNCAAAVDTLADLIETEGSAHAHL